MSKAVKAVGNAISGVVKGVVKAVTSVVRAVVDVVASVINFVAQPFMGMLGGMPDVPSAGAEAQRQQGVLIQRRGGNNNIPVVYGFRKVGGIVTFAETGSTNNQYMWVAYVLSEGPIEGLYELFLDDNQLPNDVIGNLNAGRTVDLATGKYNGRVKLQFFNGTYFSTPTSSTVGTSSICSAAPSWKTSMVYNGLAVVFARYEWKQIVTQADSDNNPFGGDIPQIQASILGRKVGSLLVANPSSTNYASTSERYSTNPAEILLDYLRNPRYGKGLVNDDIDWDSFKRAANKCNQVVTYINGITGNILSCNHVLDTGQTIFANVKTLLMGFRAYMPYIQGKYKLRIEDAGNDNDILSGVATIVATFNKDNIQGNVTYTGIERSNKYNQVVITYVDPDQKWSTQQVVYPESESERQTYISADGGRENKLDATFPTLTNYAMAKDMARLLFNKSRFQESCSLTVSSQAMELEPGDNIYIQNNLLNFTTTPWRIITATLNDDMTYDLGCVRNPDTIYPHTRYGEEDIVLPVYVPRGATIYFPTPSGSPPIGLVPPVTAPINGTTDNSTTNPPPSTPGNPVVVTGNTFTVTIASPAVFTKSNHGFIGNGREELTLSTTGALPTGLNTSTKYYVMATGLTANTFRVSLIPGGSVAVNTSGTQSGTHTYSATTFSGSITQPVQPPVAVPARLEDYIDITRITYAVNNGFVNATLFFNQPRNPNYAGVDFWYTRGAANTTAYYETLLNTNRPGAGNQITQVFPNLYKSSTPYTVLARVRYTSGEVSTFRTRVSLDVGRAIDTDNPQDGFELVTTGWTPNTTPPSNPRDTKFVKQLDNLQAFTVYASGVPATPRQIRFKVTQLTDAYDVNFNVDGVNVYHKPSSASQWTKTTYLFDSTYVPGPSALTEFLFTGDLGLPTYPTAPGASDDYDFILRFRYRDGTESTKQVKINNVNVEYQSGSNVNIITSLPIDGDAENLTLVDPATAADNREITVTFTSLFAFKDSADQQTKLSCIFTPPAATNQGSFWGLRIFYRPVTPGAAPAFNSIDVLQTNMVKFSSSEWRAFLPLAFDQEYQIVLVPLVRYPSGTLTKTLAYNAWFGQGAVHNRDTQTTGSNAYPSGGNWLTKLNLKAIKTTDMSGIEGTAFPATDPLVKVISWKLIQTNSGVVTSNANAHYYELEFDKAHISNYDKLIVYRRSFASGKNIAPNSRYNGLGRFERLEIVAGTNATTLANGNILVNLRIPTQWQEFNTYYPDAGSPPTTTGGQTFISSSMTTNVWGAQTYGTLWTNEFYLCVRSGATPAESAKMTKCQPLFGGSLLAEVSSTLPHESVDTAQYNTTIVGWQRRLTEARSRLADANYKPGGASYTAPAVRRGSSIV